MNNGSIAGNPMPGNSGFALPPQHRAIFGTVIDKDSVGAPPALVPQHNARELDCTAQLLFGPLDPANECLELRVFPGHSTQGIQPLVAYAVNAKEYLNLVMNAPAHASVYCGVNPRKRERYEMAPGRWEPASGGRASKGEHVTRRSWLFIDCDPVRAAGFEKYNASEEERQQLKAAVDALIKEAFPGEVLRANSGNGEYLLVRLDLPNTPEVNAKLEAFYKRLQ